MTPDLEQASFHRVHPAPGAPVGPYDRQVWDIYDPRGAAFAQAEVFPGDDQWRVKLWDRAPGVDASDLVKVVGRLLVWAIGTRIDTVEVVLARKVHEPQTLVRVGGEYV